MLAVEDLSLDLRTFALRHVHLHVETGQYLVLMGPTGSGKSLLAQCLCGLIRPDAGCVSIRGREVSSWEPRRRRIGYVPQEGALFPHMDAARNITFPLRVRWLSHARALGEARAVIDMLGLAGLLDRSVGTLSGGERQKVALARALVRQPDLLVLDEPVSALDEPSRRDVCAHLRAVHRRWGIATLHICHATEEAEIMADRVAVMDAGRIVQCGSFQDLRTAPADPAVARLLGPPAPHRP